MIVDLMELSPISLLYPCSSATMIFGFFFTSLNKALLWLLSVAVRPGLGRVLVIPNFFHFSIKEDSVLLGTLSTAHIIFVRLAYLYLASILSLGSLDSSFDLLILICSDMHYEL